MSGNVHCMHLRAAMIAHRFQSLYAFARCNDCTSLKSLYAFARCNELRRTCDGWVSTVCLCGPRRIGVNSSYLK